MQVDIDLVAFLLANLAGPPPIEQNKIAENVTANPAITFFRRPSFQDLFLDGSMGLAETAFDVEIYGLDIDAAESLADQTATLLNGFRGTMGSTTVLAAFVSDQADDYTPKVEQNTDEGLHLVTFALNILH